MKTIFKQTLFPLALLAGTFTAQAQVKIGTNPTTIDPSNNLEVQGSTAGRKFSIDKTTGKVTIADGTQGNGKILTSDVNGGASWQNLSGTSKMSSGYQIMYQGITNIIDFSYMQFDQEGGVDLNTNSFVVQREGYYTITVECTGRIGGYPSETGAYNLYLIKNGAVVGWVVSPTGKGQVAVPSQLTSIQHCVPGDVFQVGTLPCSGCAAGNPDYDMSMVIFTIMKNY